MLDLGQSPFNMQTFLKLIALIAIVAVGAMYFTIVLTALLVIIVAACILVLIWHINGTPFYVTKDGKVVAEYRRFRRVK